MAHKLLEEPIKENKKTIRAFKLPKLNGKFGVAIFVGGQEVFLGIAISSVEIEQIVKRRMVKNVKAGVRVLQFD